MSRPPPSAAWRSRSISRSSARPIIPGCASTRTGSSYRPDGSIKYAENPPKKYEDIVNVDFYNPDRDGLWNELRDVVLFWIDQGVRIFRVDNPHTKPVPFWEWLIREVKARCPDAIFLAEAFTRPKMMRALAKAGFTPVLYLFHLAQHEAGADRISDRADAGTGQGIFPAEFLHQHAGHPAGVPAGGRPAGVPHPARAGRHPVAVPTASITASNCARTRAIPGREEYLHSEKYEYKVWDWDRPGNIKRDIAILNRFRRDNPALHELTNLRFLDCPDPNILAYAKMTADRGNIVIAVVNLDPHGVHGGDVTLPLQRLGHRSGRRNFRLEEAFTGHVAVLARRAPAPRSRPADQPGAAIVCCR